MSLAPAVPSSGRTLEAITSGDALPAWFSGCLYVLLVWCTTAGMSALVMLSKTTYSATACAVIASVASLAAWPFRPRRQTGEPAAHGPAVAAVAIALALLALAGASKSEHLFADRDPAVYVNIGRSIARTHRVHPKVAPGPFDDRHAFAAQTTGFRVADHQLVSNFLDFLPALLALGWSVGGDSGLLLVPAVLGALALLALYALGTTLVGPRWALLGPALLALAPLQSWFARDAYAELPLEVIALGGLWLLIEARRDGGVLAGGIAGVILGAVTWVRIDALAILVAIPVALAVEGLRAAELDDRARRRRRAALLSCAITLGATAWGGLFVSRRLSPDYVKDLGHNLRMLELTVGVSIAAAVGVFVVHRLRAGIGHRLARSNLLVSLAAALTAGLAAYAYKLRPHTGPIPALPTPLMPAPARHALQAYFFSASFRWFAWYLGTATLAFAVVGFIVLGVRATRSDSPTFLFLSAAVPVTLLYIARPSVTPDHLWAMRRYLPIALPALTIAAAAAAMWSSSIVGARFRRVRAPLVVALVAIMVLPAARAGQPLLRAQMQGGALAAVHHLCDTAGADAAIAVAADEFLDVELPQTLRGFCGVPAAGLVPDVSVPLGTYAQRWKTHGRQLFLVSSGTGPDPDATARMTPVARVVVEDAREPERALGRRADTYAPRPVEVRLYRVDPI